MSIDTIVGLIGDVFTAVAALAAVVALVYARRTVIVARTAREEADAAAKEAAVDRRRAANQAAAERNEADYRHMIRQADRVAEIVETLFWRAASHSPNSQQTIVPAMDATKGWMAERNRLGVALVGVTSMLPKCAEILNAATPQAAFAVAPAPARR